MVPTEDSTSKKINEIREKALGHPHEKCPTCGRFASSPYRVFDARGHVVEGCIDSHHSGHLVVPSESNRWHNRPEAKGHRLEELEHLKSLTKRKR